MIVYTTRLLLPRSLVWARLILENRGVAQPYWGSLARILGKMMRRFAEELLLLLLNEDAGDLAFVPEPQLYYALAGAVLMDLALANRTDTDPAKLVVLDPTPLEDDLLDPPLARLAQSTETYNAAYRVGRIAEEGDQIRATALSRLVQAGILDTAEEGAIALARGVAQRRLVAIRPWTAGPSRKCACCSRGCCSGTTSRLHTTLSSSV